MHPQSEGTQFSVGVLWALVGAPGEGQPVRRIRIMDGRSVVGRWSDTDIRLDFHSVSKRHAEMLVADGRLRVVDLSSTNGTFVNGKRIASETVLVEGDVLQFANATFQVMSDQPSAPDRTQAEKIVDRAMALLQFDRLMSKRTVMPHYQPIVTLPDRETIAYEVLARSQTLGLESAQELFAAAALVQQESELSRLMREEGLRASHSIVPRAELFLNTHPAEIDNDGLVNSLKSLRAAFPEDKFTLEIHESAVTDPRAMRQLRDELKALDVKLAYDDFGTGQARLLELMQVPPHYLKFDRRLIQNIETASAPQQQMLGTLIRMVRDLGIVTLAEGVETEGESETCAQLGFELGQGFYYGRPSSAAKWARAN